MATSQNGWTINPPLQELTVYGVTFGGARTGDAHVVLEYVATRYHREVERLISGTCGCYNPRLIPGTNVWSNHASATAIDCNWARHPLGARGTYTAAQVAAIRRILAFCGGVIRWGGDYTNSVDEMHFEINKDAVAVHALAAKIKAEAATMNWSDPFTNTSYANRYGTSGNNYGTALILTAIKAYDANKNAEDAKAQAIANGAKLDAILAKLDSWDATSGLLDDIKRDTGLTQVILDGLTKDPRIVGYDSPIALNVWWAGQHPEGPTE